MIDIVELSESVRNVLDKKSGGTLHMSSATYEEFEPYVTFNEENKPVYYGAVIKIDNTLKSEVIQVW